MAIESTPLAEINSLKFYHGTSNLFATAILKSPKTSVFPYEQCLQLGQTLFKRCMSHVDAWIDLAVFFQEAGCKNWSNAPLGLKNIADGVRNSSVEYGALYATPDPMMAQNYTIRNKCGSELITTLQSAIQALAFHEDVHFDEFRAKFPEFFRIVEIRHDPVVLEFTGLSLDQLAQENGDRDIKNIIQLCLDHARNGESLPDVAFRIDGLCPSQISAVFPLTDAAALPFNHKDFESRRILSDYWLRSQA